MQAEVDAEAIVVSLLGVVGLEGLADFVCLDANDGVVLRIEIGAALINIDPDRVLVDALGDAGDSLLAHEFQEAALLPGLDEMPAGEDAIELLAHLGTGQAAA